MRSIESVRRHLTAEVRSRSEAAPKRRCVWERKVHLAIPGSVIGFTAYLTLVRRLGADRAAYCTVLFPIVALNVSALVEGFHWTAPALLGLLLVAAGNVVVFWRGSVPRLRSA